MTEKPAEPTFPMSERKFATQSVANSSVSGSLKSWGYPYESDASGSGPLPSYGASTSHSPSSVSVNSQGNPYLIAYGSNFSSSQSLPHHYTHLLPQPTAKNAGKNQPTNIAMSLADPLHPTKKSYKHWEEALEEFFMSMRMFESLKGLQKDFLVLNPDWEQKTLFESVGRLIQRLKIISDNMASGNANPDPKQTPDEVMSQELETQEQKLGDRKLHFVKLADGKPAQRPSEITKTISQFIARSRARNNASNRSEFLTTLAEKKRAVETQNEPDDETQSSCARADARTVDREKQIKYDIAKNEDGPLDRKKGSKEEPVSADIASAPTPVNLQESRPHKRRKIVTTVEHDDTRISSGMEVDQSEMQEEINTSGQAISMGQRMKNLEDHLAVRYVPTLPRTIVSRIKYLEDYLVKLEKEYPPWAALHFNQPNRGWPPPPRSTPLIVPPHLRSVDKTVSVHDDSPTNEILQSQAELSSSSKGKTRKPSTLQRAIENRLAVQQAMEEIHTKGEK